MLRKSGIAVIVIIVAISAVAFATMGYDGANVNVYSDDHVKVDKTSDFLGRTVLKAEIDDGYRFDGWYDENNVLLSAETTYAGIFSDGQVFYASSLKYVNTEAGKTVDLATYMDIPDSQKLTVSPSDYDGSTATVSGTKVTTTKPGTYKCVYFDNSEHVRSATAVLADGTIQKTYEWTYSTSSIPAFSINPFKPVTKTNDYKLTVDIQYSDYVHYTGIYMNEDSPRWGRITESDPDADDIAHDVAYVHYDSVQDKYIDKVCNYIKTKTLGKNDQYVANVILSFVQAIEYKSDQDVHGVSEYWQFPLETMFLSSGDCEDTSILFCAIAERMGYDTCYFLYSGHMNAGVNIDNFVAPTRTSSSIYSGAYGWKVETGTTPEGEKIETPFYCCETTNTGWQVGEIPESEYSLFRFGVPISSASTEANVALLSSEGVSASATTSSSGRTTLVATTDGGLEFTGWFDSDGNLLSTSATFSGEFAEGATIYAVGGPAANADRPVESGEKVAVKDILGPAYSDSWHIVKTDVEGPDGICIFPSSGLFVATDERSCVAIFVYPRITVYIPDGATYSLTVGDKGLGIDVTIPEGMVLDGMYTHDSKISENCSFFGQLNDGDEVYVLAVDNLNSDYSISPAGFVDLSELSGISDSGTWSIMTIYFDDASETDISGSIVRFNNPGTYIITFKNEEKTWCSTVSVDRSGTYQSFAITGWTLVQSGIFPYKNSISGTMTSEYVSYNFSYGDYLIHQTYSFSTGVAGDSYRWGSEDDPDDYTETYLGLSETDTANFGKKTCAVWELGYTSSGYKVTETQYIDSESSYVYFINVDYSYNNETRIHYEYVLCETGTRTVDIPSSDIVAYSDTGITVSIKEAENLGDTATLRAEVTDGTTFEGWYDEGMELLSTEIEYTVRTGIIHTIYARTSGDAQVMTGSPVDLSSLLDTSVPAEGTWSALDLEGRLASEDVVSISAGKGTFSDMGGKYILKYTDETSGTYRIVTVVIDGIKTVSYSWKYGGHTYSLDLDILYSDYIHYVEAYPVGDRVTKFKNASTGDDAGLAHDISFVHFDDVQTKYIKTIADYIRNNTEGMDEQQVANVILRFCQASTNYTKGISYVSDYSAHGTEEYWQFPLETLYLKTGDCEDTSFLFTAIASYMGYHTCLFRMTGHMAAGITLESFTPTPISSSDVSSTVYGMEIDGIMYYYCETTNNAWNVGNVWTSEFVDAFEYSHVLPDYD